MQDPDLDVNDLGVFASAKAAQNLVLIEAYKTVGGAGDVPQLPEGNEPEFTETPAKEPPREVTNYSIAPKDTDAADETVVNQALAIYLQALTRQWMGRFHVVDGRQPGSPGPFKAEKRTKMLARWTPIPKRFHIKELVDGDDPVQKAFIEAHPLCKVASGTIQLLETHTDGHLQDTKQEEVLAIVEVKKRMRRKDALLVEWQEAAEILAWLNIRLRMQLEEEKRMVPSDKTRGSLMAPQGKYRYAARSAVRGVDHTNVPMLQMPPSPTGPGGYLSGCGRMGQGVRVLCSPRQSPNTGGYTKFSPTTAPSRTSSDPEVQSGNNKPRPPGRNVQARRTDQSPSSWYQEEQPDWRSIPASSQWLRGAHNAKEDQAALSSSQVCDWPRRISASLVQTGEGQSGHPSPWLGAARAWRWLCDYPGRGSRLPDLARIRAVQDKRRRTYAGSQQKSARHGATFGWRGAERGYGALGRAAGPRDKIPIDAIFVGGVMFPQGTKGGQPHEQDPRSHGPLKDSLSTSQFPRNS